MKSTTPCDDHSATTEYRRLALASWRLASKMFLRMLSRSDDVNMMVMMMTTMMLTMVMTMKKLQSHSKHNNGDDDDDDEDDGNDSNEAEK